ncbi:hypothetical protein EIN_330380 [Entamoeba invadens IP1]|uniref:Fe-containing alcohol dehydrogenase-like C-terminal domain-containing protein n=1 Tax=Entamoeba invadens IP1 TaxID=370355 RepID=L7FLK6_ENTIV|nr:hypothetical protein EIN_330380 [Entamoeba invadens IP1]ELP88754.1 hypothetical protein EIN_330380 [Entamoeba invadens IP1]|eukprot:XP_004255525.1 hypothetical protein EIN_330380 [Entamoeba invadens IP1]
MNSLTTSTASEVIPPRTLKPTRSVHLKIIIDSISCYHRPNVLCLITKRAIADCGIDFLVHAVEAYVSVMADKYKDGLAKEAVELVFDNLVELFNGVLLPERRCTTLLSLLELLSIFHMVDLLQCCYHMLFDTMVLFQESWRCVQSTTCMCMADERYNNLAHLVGLKTETTAEGVEVLAKARTSTHIVFSKNKIFEIIEIQIIQLKG